MKIAQSAIQFYSERNSIEKHQKRESLTTWKPGGDEHTVVQANGGQGQELEVPQSMSILVESSKVTLSQQAITSRSVGAIESPVSEEKELMVNLNLRILQSMIERLTGKRVRLFVPPSQQPLNEIPQAAEVGSATVPAAVEGEEGQAPSQGGLIYEYYESQYESESTSFAANGKIVTEDGQEIDFSVDLNMSREFFSEERLTIRAGDALKDPLVVNFSGTAAELSQTKFSFDIDNDGTDNQISFLTPGSGFLALDKNGDGTINNGSELFGPVSGNGFQDLAAYDSDDNKWIDENDSIYNRLRVWTKDSAGNDSLFALGEKGIGAIYLGAANTLFSMTDAENNLLGQVQSTGVFLQENGGVGTVQQIDLVA